MTGDRAAVLAALEAERLQAVGCHEHGRAAEIASQVARLSQGTAGNPATETTAARRPARSKR